MYACYARRISIKDKLNSTQSTKPGHLLHVAIDWAEQADTERAMHCRLWSDPLRYTASPEITTGAEWERAKAMTKI